MAMKKKKEITLDDLALMMGRGFNEARKKMDRGFASVDERLAEVNEKIDANTADIKYLKSEVNLLKNGIEKFIMFYEKQE